jgi:hypothetical protein
MPSSATQFFLSKKELCHEKYQQNGVVRLPGCCAVPEHGDCLRSGWKQRWQHDLLAAGG